MLRVNPRVGIVLGSLLAAMTIASSLLLALEPRPVRRYEPTQLRQLDVHENPLAVLGKTETQIDPARWSRVVIHDSGSLAGDTRALTEAHQQHGARSLGYHFVIDLGTDGTDAHIEVGPRWQQQQQGAFFNGPTADHRFVDGAVGICVIGDTHRQPLTNAQLSQIQRLVVALQTKLNLPVDTVDTATLGPYFPAAQLRRNLLH